MNYSTDNTRIIDRRKVPAPYELVNKFPINNEISKLVYGTRNEISQILHGKDDRLFIVVGPCSIHDPVSALEYAERLVDANKKFNENLLIIMRVYFEKPRTTIGWKGLINDPDMVVILPRRSDRRTALPRHSTCPGTPSSLCCHNPGRVQYRDVR